QNSKIKSSSSSSSSSSSNNNAFNINTKYAREYEQRKRREELTKHRKVDFDLGEDNNADDDSSSSESEDEEGDLLTPHLDAQIIKTLKALKRKDDSVYDRNSTFYDKNNDSDDDTESGGENKEKMKRKTYKDVVREQILEQMDDEDDTKDSSKKKDTDTDGSAGDLAYDEEQRDIRRAFLESTRDGGNDNESENDSDDDDWIKPKTKSKSSSDNQDNDEDGDDDEARKLWEQELQDTEAVAASGKSTNGLVDPHGEVKDGDKFLMEFMTHKKWLENGADKFNPDKDNDDDQSLEDLERMDEFESKYNFRFEEAADTAHNNMDSGASHSIVHYARGSNAENVLRRKDESRRQKRLARKERKAEERKAKEEQLKRLKNARREELDERMKQVRNVLGNEDGQAADAALGSAEEEMILKLMEGDYNPEKFEQVMNSVYGDEYYEKEDGAWKNDQDVKRDLASGQEESDILGDGEMYDEENADDADNYDEDVYDEDYEEEEDEYDDGQAHFEAENEETEMDKKLKNKMMDELYKLDYEDIIGDMPTRFKYRTVERNSYGLSTEEILFAKDSSLKQFVSLKKMATYNEEEYKAGAKKRKRFRQLLKADREEMKDEVGAVDENPVESSAGDGEKKKKRRRQKKGSKKSSESTSEITTGSEKETTVDQNDDSQEPEKKRRRKKKKSLSKTHPEESNNASTVNVVETRKERSKKRSDGNKKKKHSSTVEGVSGARLAAYGF
ncbi:hypothetical protein ACHAWC_006922, partial [Mediolabrus comicus]